MKQSHIWILTAIALSAVAVFTIGCDKEPTASASTSEVPVCSSGGEIEGTKACSDTVAAQSSCTMDKGAPGCSKSLEGAEKASSCTGCDQMKDSDSCCKSGAEKSGGCELDKGASDCSKEPKSI